MHAHPTEQTQSFEARTADVCRAKTGGTGATQSLQRAAAALNAIASAEGEGMRLKTVAERTGVHIATTRRLLQTMVGEGMLSFDRRRKLYRIGPTIYAHAAAASPWYGQQHLFQPVIEEVADRSGDTAMLHLPVGNEAVCLMRCEGAYPIRIMTLKVGSRRPLGVGSGCLALLAFLRADDRTRIVSNLESSFAAYGMTADEVLTAASCAERQGYAVNNGRIIAGIVGVAVAAMSQDRPVAAISVAATDRRMTEAHQREVVEIISEAVAAVPSLVPSTRL